MGICGRDGRYVQRTSRQPAITALLLYYWHQINVPRSTGSCEGVATLHRAVVEHVPLAWLAGWMRPVSGLIDVDGICGTGK